MAGYRFPKTERVCAKRDVELLFGNAKAIRSGVLSLRYAFRQKHDDADVKVLIVVPKRRVKKAVKRNRLKRQLREIYRLNKVDWNGENLPVGKTLLLAILYFGPAEALYSDLEKAYIHALKRLKGALNKETINKN